MDYGPKDIGKLFQLTCPHLCANGYQLSTGMVGTLRQLQPEGVLQLWFPLKSKGLVGSIEIWIHPDEAPLLMGGQSQVQL